ncbi:hypothetical protein IFM89_028374 [Coptis chinensis]|uniref:Transposase MuDR plant domain-containing protein n=1 Tax=Coptis chinensis TaxID=261450 RepID=A0A835MAZ0_9MAGN|nr:hypothetical protein IFM89_028374 [Coptis chinensis]
MGFIEDIHRSVGDDVPINGVNCICRGFLTTIYNDVGVLKMWDTIKAEKDQKFHLFVTMVTLDMMQPTKVLKPKLHSKPNAKPYKKPSIVSKSKLVSTQIPSTPTKPKFILNFEVRRSPRFSSQLSPINLASPVIQLSPCEDEDAYEGIQVDEGIQQTAEDVVNDFAELFETGEAFVDAVEEASAQEENNGEVQNDDSEDEEDGKYFEKLQTGGPCVDMRCGYATNLEEGADDVIDSLGLGTSNLYQGEPIPSVEDEDIKEDNKLKLEPGMQWKSMPECRSYLKSLAIQDIFSFKQKQNDTKRYIIYCIGEDHADKEIVKPCTWKVACSITRDHHTVKLRKFVGTYTCEANGKNHVKQAKAPWVAQVLEDFLRDHPNMKHLDVHKEVWRRFGVELSYYTTWKAKVKMFEKINGNYEASYLIVSELKKQIEIKNVEIGDEVLPPPLERKSGRPRKQRIRDAYEERPSKKRVCKLCHVPGHNKRTCPMREQGGTKGMSKENVQLNSQENVHYQETHQENVQYQETHQENVQVNSQTNVHSQENVQVNSQTNVQVEHVPRAGRGGRAGRRGRGTGRGMAYWFGEDTPASSSQATPPPPLNETQ